MYDNCEFPDDGELPVFKAVSFGVLMDHVCVVKSETVSEYAVRLSPPPMFSRCTFPQFLVYYTANVWCLDDF